MPWQPEFLMESNSVNSFWRGSPKEHSCQVWSKLAQRFGRRRCLKKLLMTHDGHLTTLKAPLEHVVLRWAKKHKNTAQPWFGMPSRKMVLTKMSVNEHQFRFFLPKIPPWEYLCNRHKTWNCKTWVVDILGLLSGMSSLHKGTLFIREHSVHTGINQNKLLINYGVPISFCQQLSDSSICQAHPITSPVMALNHVSTDQEFKNTKGKKPYKNIHKKEIKALKMLVWHLSRKPKSGINSLRK